MRGRTRREGGRRVGEQLLPSGRDAPPREGARAWVNLQVHSRHTYGHVEHHLNRRPRPVFPLRSGNDIKRADAASCS